MKGCVEIWVPVSFIRLHNTKLEIDWAVFKHVARSQFVAYIFMSSTHLAIV